MKADVLEIWTIGHSTRSIEEFISLLEENEIQMIADVRHFPGSRRYPHFGQPQLAESLRANGIKYLHFPELGGRRQPRLDSRNLAWRNEGFRGYADYMETEDFRKGMARLTSAAREHRLAIMCAEAMWWKCHRSLIADWLKAEGWRVRNILAAGKLEEHPFTTAARLVAGKLSYRGEESELELPLTAAKPRVKRL